MFECSIRTQKYESFPVWTCQSEPDDYTHKEFPPIIKDNLTPEQISDSVLSVFLQIILKKPNVESLYIESNHLVNKWPDEWGGIRVIHQLTCKRKSEVIDVELTEMEITLQGYNSEKGRRYTKDGTKIDGSDIAPEYWQEIIKEFYQFKMSTSIDKLQVKIYERKE